MAEFDDGFDVLMLSLSAPRRRSAAVIIALALSAAACGSGEEAATPTLATTPAAASGESGGAGETADDDATADAGEVVEPEAGSDVQGPEPDDDQPVAEPPTENLFPDIDVVNITDGSTLNLAAELGGGDRPTLLWFWAPH